MDGLTGLPVSVSEVSDYLQLLIAHLAMLAEWSACAFCVRSSLYRPMSKFLHESTLMEFANWPLGRQ